MQEHVVDAGDRGRLPRHRRHVAGVARIAVWVGIVRGRWRLGARIGRHWGFVDVAMVTEVARGGPRFVLAIAAHGRPGGLERQQKQEEKHEGLAHGRGVYLNIMKVSRTRLRAFARPQETQSVRDHQQTGAHVGEHRHPHGGLAEECQHHEDSFDTDRQRYVLP